MKNLLKRALFVLSALAIIIAGVSCKKQSDPIKVEDSSSSNCEEELIATFRVYQNGPSQPTLEIVDSKYSETISIRRYSVGVHEITTGSSYEYETLKGAFLGEVTEGRVELLKVDVDRFYLHTFDSNGSVSDNILNGKLLFRLVGERK